MINKGGIVRQPIQKSKLYYQHSVTYILRQFVSEKSFCRVVACKVPSFSEEFFSLFSKDTDIDPGGYTSRIFDNILRASFIHKESTLNRENQYDGLAGIKSLTLTIFENHKLLQQRNPFGSLLCDRIEFREDWQINLYFSCLKKAIKTSFNVLYEETPDGHEIISPEYEILKNIYDACLGYDRIGNGILRNIPFNLSFEKKINLLDTISFEIQNLLIFIDENKHKIKAFSIDHCNVIPNLLRRHIPKYHKISLYHVLAKMIFDLLIALSRINVESSNNLSRLKHIGINCIDTLFIYQKSPINKILITYIKTYIDEVNFKQRHDSAFTKYMLLLSGLYYPKIKENKLDKLETEWDKFRVYLLDKLKKEFHSLYTTKASFALDMLPFDFSYDPSTKVITQDTTSRWQEKATLKCE